jgi:hypothetical protein
MLWGVVVVVVVLLAAGAMQLMWQLMWHLCCTTEPPHTHADPCYAATPHRSDRAIQTLYTEVWAQDRQVEAEGQGTAAPRPAANSKRPAKVGLLPMYVTCGQGKKLVDASSVCRLASG